MALMGHADEQDDGVALQAEAESVSVDGGEHVPEYVDLRVHDRVALDEIELYAEVLSAVAASDGPLTNEELDEVLGVRPQVKVLGRIALRPAGGGRGHHHPLPGTDGDSRAAWVPAQPYMTSVVVRSKPSEPYSRIAARLDSST
jgi:hypothetical protein